MPPGPVGLRTNVLTSIHFMTQAPTSGSPRTDLPTPDPSTEAYWQAASEGTLLIKRCDACGRHHFYPRPFCPWCWSGQVTWTAASGRATLYTYSVVRANGLAPFADRVPYVAAIVELEEGPRMMTNVVDCDESDLRIGMALTLAWRPLDDGLTAAVFRPA
jgi:uncharacterized protein